MTPTKGFKIMENKLLELRDLMNEISIIGSDLTDEEKELIWCMYPFAESFNDIALDVSNWVDIVSDQVHS